MLFCLHFSFLRENVTCAGFVEFAPEIGGSDQATKLLLSSEDLVCLSTVLAPSF